MRIINSTTQYKNNIDALPARRANTSFKGAGTKLGSQAAGAAADTIKGFGGKIVNVVSEKLSNLLGRPKIYEGINKLANSRNSYLHLMTFESIFLTGFYMFNTAKNKDIKKEQKFPLMLNDALVTTLATVLNYTLNNSIDKKFGKITNGVKKLLRKDTIEELIGNKEIPSLSKDFLESEISGESIKNFSMKKVKELQDAAKKGTITKAQVKEEVGKMITTTKNAIGYDIKHAIEDKFEIKLDPRRVGKCCNENELKMIDSFTNSITNSSLAKASKEIHRIDKVVTGLDLCKKMFIFAIIYRYIAPVIITPIANKISYVIQHRNDKKTVAPSK